MPISITGESILPQYYKVFIMPIEVRELIIKTVVDAVGEKVTSSAEDNQPVSTKVVVEGLEKLLELIQNKNER